MSFNLMKTLKSAAVIAMLAAANIAHADLLQFNLTGAYTASWESASTPKPIASASDYFDVLVTGTFPDAPGGEVVMAFYAVGSSTHGGSGLVMSGLCSTCRLVSSFSDQLYTGSTKAPTYKVGTFDLTGIDGKSSYVLTVTDLDAPAAVPEPATIATLLGGLGLMAALRKRRAGR